MKLAESIWKIVNLKVFFFLILFIIASLFVMKSDKYFGWTNEVLKNGEPIISDGAGYYAYLPQWFIYHTENFEFIDSITAKYPNSRFGLNPNERNKQDKLANKYFTGTAIVNIPFFLIAHAQAGWSGLEQDGYSWPYLLWVNLSGIIYFILGCIGFYFFLRLYNFQRFWILVGIIGIAFGTNLSYYVNVQIPFAHVFSFAANAWILYLFKRWITKYSLKLFVLVGLIFGLSFIIRPTNFLMILVLPFLFDSFDQFKLRLISLVKENKLMLFCGLFSFLLFIFFQMYLIHAQNGEWVLNAYSKEGFDNWKHPEIWNVLFSWRKGLFIFTPILVLVLPGLFILLKRNRYLFYGISIFLVVSTYIISSWWCWWYGGGLGMRAYIDFFPLLFIPIVAVLHYAKVMYKLISLVFIVATCWIYQVYEFQMKNNILHYDDMNYEQFSKVFMKEDLRYVWGLHLTYDSLPDNACQIAVPAFFKVASAPISSIKIEYDGETWDDNPVLELNLREYHLDTLDYYFGARLNFDVRILSPETNPNFLVQYTKDSVLVKEYNIYFGAMIETPFEWTSLEADLNPMLKYGKDFDALRVVFLEGSTIIEAKNFEVRYFKF